ncbi:alpha-2-macroglobulin family protein [Candidimonas nitroreducens]|uniref:Alpha-2-macroglobulin n=1 Tax=Candidimonas nitroreducens TaxID=683354 RepID=A0A225LVM0_9BURK|nr:MG2 domain-containing protein [Candidimonas nitroreducens]OWT53417.1 alpha-2-macroglobulin [Candidimonas nitroreducens]
MPARTQSRLLAFGLLWLASGAWAAQVAQFSPQGAVARVESVKVTFDVPVVAFGSAQAPAPFDVQCDDASITGSGRWLDGRRWTYVFTHQPGPGVQCKAQLRPGFHALDGKPLSGPTEFSFATGGPVVLSVQPDGSVIDEDQAFVLRFNGAVKPESLQASTWCLAQGLGEAIPVRLINGEQRQAILKAAYIDKDSWNDAAIQVLQCKRRLPPQAKFQLRVGPGVQAVSGVASTQAAVSNYTVRPPFKATFSCQRENARAACTPVLPISLDFNANLSYADAQKIRLKTPEGERSPASDDDAAREGMATGVRFAGPFPENADMSIVLPPGLKDDAGRPLANASEFPLQVRTAGFPPLVKFAAAPFGVIERFANAPQGGSDDDYPAAVPLTVRNVEQDLPAHDLKVPAGTVSDFVPQSDVDVLHWYARMRRLHEASWTPAQLRAIMADQQPRPDKADAVAMREVPVIAGLAGVRTLKLPQPEPGATRPFEVIGVPVSPGFHVLEVKSARLGAALIAPDKPMYVRTSALVTNLSVHLKQGRDDTLVWVTTLDQGKVVPNAAVAVRDCSGRLLAEGKTDAQGIWHDAEALRAQNYCRDTDLSGLFVTARIPADHPLARGKADFAFVFSDWDQGIESWRFNVPTNTSPNPTVVAHTMFDRTLLRVGETVSMKHFMRVLTRGGMKVPDDADLPNTLFIRHMGSGQEYHQSLHWVHTPSGGVYAQSSFAIPPAAKQGEYGVSLAFSGKSRGQSRRWFSGSFRVESFKLPVLTGSLKISDEKGGTTLVAPSSLSADVQLAYVSGGPAGQLPVSLSGVARYRSVHFSDYSDYSFYPPRQVSTDEQNGEPGEQSADESQTLFLNKQRLVLDAQGGGRLAIAALPKFDRPKDLVFEASFADPNGEIQTLSQTVPVWPAALLAGIRADDWVQAGKPVNVRTVALDTAGRPQAGTAITVQARRIITYSARKRMVGGFYSYDNHTEAQPLGTVCQGKTDAHGEFRCAAQVKGPGSIELVASVTDAQGHVSSAAASTWVLGADELWFGGQNDDRIDIVPEKKAYQAGETASFQVRMPFREATALVAVEREGVLATQVVHLEGNNPTVQLPVQAQWGPNVYVSVLALRGRLREVPWYSFFTWGWRQPSAWYHKYSQRDREPYQAATALIDLSKPAFRYGLTEIKVSDKREQLAVKVSTDKKTYQVRGKAQVSIQVTLPDGSPAANGEVAFAAVDQALLELMPNDSWDLLGAMRRRRAYGVQTATAQLQVVGRRHYGRKALPAGGGGGKSPTRELLDTLLLWKPAVQLDKDGKASITVPLNDAITRFKLVAVADYGAERFGTGSATIASTQDLQLIPGLPELVRGGDRYEAMVTVRNTTKHAMDVEVKAAYAEQSGGQSLPVRTVHVAAGAAGIVHWALQAPLARGTGAAEQLQWDLQARELGATAPARDHLRIAQTLIAAVPVTAQQATLLAVDADHPPAPLPVAVPPGALAGPDGRALGGLDVTLQSTLAGGLPGVRQWFERYPYTCLEQLTSIALGLHSAQRWQTLQQRIASYVDADGLLSYFPGMRYGSAVLTAYVLTASNEAQALGLPYTLPEPVLQSMRRGLLAFVQGKIQRRAWAPQRDLDERKLLALEALSRIGAVTPALLDSIAIAPDRWPTSAVIDWLAVLQRVPAIPGRAAKLQKATQVLRARLLDRGTEMVFPDDRDNNWWWLMVSPQVNLAKLMLTVIGQPGWEEDVPRLAQGLLHAQHRGAWRTTTANLLGSLAMEKFARHYETTPVSGRVAVRMGSQASAATVDWSALPVKDGVRSKTLHLPWAGASDSLLIQPQGRGQGWATVRSMAAVPVTKPLMAGFAVTRKVSAVSQARSGVWSRGDVYRVQIEVVSKTPGTWVVVNDPIPAGATILGSGLGRDSSIAAQPSNAAEETAAWPSFVERGFDAYRAYYEYFPQGKTLVEYTVRLNTPGQFRLPPTRVEAMYQPDVFGVLPNSRPLDVQASTDDGQ